MLEGVRVLDLKRITDDRGYFSEIMRSDWDEFLEGDEIVQSNLSISNPGVIRGWHKHERDQVDYFLVIKGSMQICAFDEQSNELDEIIVNDENPKLIRIPGKYWHGTKNLGAEPSIIVYFHSKLYDYKNPDEGRRLWNDSAIIPKSVNGKTNDHRVGKSWNWSRL